MTTLQNLLAASTGTWTLASDRSTVQFRTKTLWGLTTVTGTFTEVSGSGTVADDVTGRVVIRAASLKTGIRKRDEHLRSADFFDVDNHPELVIEINGAQPSGDGALLATTFTIRGTNRPVRLPIDIDVLDDGSLKLTGRCTLDRHDFGVSGNQLGMVGTSTDVSAELVFTRA
jgi:polyisoprenoid-binding protein YceI